MPLTAAMVSAVVIAFILTSAVVFLNERYAFLRGDRFPSRAAKWGAYGWLALFILVVVFLVLGASQHRVTAADVAGMRFESVFSLHIILIVFLFGWWLLTSRPKLGDYLNLHRRDPLVTAFTGVAVGIGGWALTLAIALAIGAALSGLKLVPADMKPSPMIPWLAALPLWQKGLVVLAAMTVEEAFFRGWLQKRFGLIASTTLFALAHAGYGQPLMLVGITIVSLIIGYTFYRTKNLWPCIIAHGVFDAVQIFVIVPLALKMMG